MSIWARNLAKSFLGVLNRTVVILRKYSSKILSFYIIHSVVFTVWIERETPWKIVCHLCAPSLLASDEPLLGFQQKPAAFNLSILSGVILDFSPLQYNLN